MFNYLPNRLEKVIILTLINRQLTRQEILNILRDYNETEVLETICTLQYENVIGYDLKRVPNEDSMSSLHYYFVSANLDKILIYFREQ